MQSDWYKHAIVYQIYPRSFKDSNGDGVGDLQGIISKIDYIKSLGVDAVWLNPIYKSPNDDGGYDISDYYAIQPEFGTMADFDELLAKLHGHGIKLIMDLVLNHSSDEHEWFVESRKSKQNSFRDYYFWRDGANNGPPNNWPSFFGGSAWQKDELTGQYYLHLFSCKQPDLNWEISALREEVHGLMRFWLDKGVDGLRLDVISAISKRVDFPNTDTNDFNETIRKYYANGPRLREFIAEARHRVWDRYNVMTVGEGPGITPENAIDYLDELNGLSMIFHFGHMFMDQGPGGRFDPIAWSLKDFKQIFKTWDDAFAHQGWGSVFLGNHDFPRMVSRWGNDREYWEQSSKLLITLLLSMRGTPFIFQGDEIGMTNTCLNSVSESRDIETQNGWKVAQERGMGEADFLKLANRAGRDNARTPMQWNSKQHGGFSVAEPWMPVNVNTITINVQNQNSSADSILNYFRSMARIRKQNPVLSIGKFEPLETEDENLFAFWRTLNEDRMLVLLNFSAQTANFSIPTSAKKIIGNYPSSKLNELMPW
ncbi:MAG: glycoside hydrolase family 13 protein [Cytophagales bacterium]